MSSTLTPVEKLKIRDIEIYLEDFGDNKGKMILSNTYGNSYSYYWGSMGSSLKKFLCEISSDYFARCLMGSKKYLVTDWKKTFKTFRKFIKEELPLPWYEHMEFQKQMREVLNDFQKTCIEWDSDELFVSMFEANFIDRLDFYLVDDNMYSNARCELKKKFDYISEVWFFLEKTEGPEFLWLIDVHKLLKKELSKKL